MNPEDKFIHCDGGLSAVGLREKDDCVVRAVAVATSQPYERVHVMFKRAGRKDGRTFGFRVWMHGRKRINRHSVRDVRLEVGEKTVGGLLKANLQGRFIARVRRHVFAMIDGVVFDTQVTPLGCRITHLWRVE